MELHDPRREPIVTLRGAIRPWRPVELGRGGDRAEPSWSPTRHDERRPRARRRRRSVEDRALRQAGASSRLVSALTPTQIAAARVLERVRSAAEPRAVVEAFGSNIYAPAHAEDVDVLVSEDDPERLAARTGLVRLPTLPPRLHGVLDGQRVDVTVVSGDDEVTRRMRSGPRDAAMLA